MGAAARAWSVAVGGITVLSAMVFLSWIGIAPRLADAYTISSVLTPGCHEDITTEVLRRVRADVPAAAALPTTRDEQALVDDMQFVAAADMKDLGAATLLLSVRDNDLKGRSSDDLTQLAQVHGNPDNQDEHCLRSAGQDEPDGSRAAVESCRTFIRGRFVEALAGLDPDGLPDTGVRTDLPVHLALRGNVDASLPTFYVRIGQAIHALEDTFTHAYRTPDGMAITVVLNWVDKANGIHDESRDGPAHASALDACDDSDELKARNRRLATEASVALLRAALDTRQTPERKMATLDGILDTYVRYAPGCNFGNAWCDAVEARYVDPGSTVLGCSSGGAGMLGVLGAFLALAFARRRSRGAASVAVLLLAAAATFATSKARADDPAPARVDAPVAPVTDPHAPPPPTTVPVPQPGPDDPSQMAWGGFLGVSGSVDKPAASIQLGVRLRLSTNWTVGWDAEWNPWISTTGETPVRAGTLNTFGTVILRFPLAYENFNLRTTVNLGISYLLIDLYGAPKGSVGLYAAIYPLGLEWKLSRVFLLIINPLGIAVPMPQLKGIPFTYPQYRFSIGLGILAG